MKHEMLAKLEAQIQALEEEKKQVSKTYWHWHRFPEEKLAPLIDFIDTNPGCTKQDIRIHFKVSEKELNALMMKASRNWELIENRGTKRHPKWYKVL